MTVEYTGGWWGGILFSSSLPQVQIHVSLWALTLAQDSRETEALGKHRVDSVGLWVWRRVSKQAVGKSCNPLRITPLEQTWHEAVPLSPKTHKLEPAYTQEKLASNICIPLKDKSKICRSHNNSCTASKCGLWRGSDYLNQCIVSPMHLCTEVQSLVVERGMFTKDNQCAAFQFLHPLT
jgi:hypothetical protein